jgi:hypothetical protein
MTARSAEQAEIALAFVIVAYELILFVAMIFALFPFGFES